MKQDLLPTFSSQPVKISLELWTLTGSFHNEPHFLRQKKKKKNSYFFFFKKKKKTLLGGGEFFF